MSRILAKSKKNKLVLNEKQPVQYFILKMVSVGKRVKLSDVVERIEKTISEKDICERKIKPSYTIKRTIKKLHDTGLLFLELEESIEYIKLTQNGIQKLQDQMLISKDSLVPVSGWNGTYRIVIITTKNKNERENIRYALSRAQFESISHGVYVTKLNMDHIVTQLKNTYPKGLKIFKGAEL